MMDNSRFTLLSFVTLAVAIAAAGCSKKKAGGCTQDTDCKGDRVCSAGQCVDQAPSNAATASSAPAPAPSEDDVAESQLVVTTSAQVLDTAVVNPPSTYDRAIVRESPDQGSKTVTSLVRGTVVSSVELSSDGLWRRIRWTAPPAGEGWMHRDVLGAPGAPPPAPKSPPPAAKAAPKDGCVRQNQLCLIGGQTAGICMDFNGLVCAMPPGFSGSHHDGCRSRLQPCRCSNTGFKGACNLGPHKAGLYCRCD